MLKNLFSALAGLWQTHAKKTWIHGLLMAALFVAAFGVLKLADPLAHLMNDPDIAVFGYFASLGLMGLAAAHLGLVLLLMNPHMREWIEDCKGSPDAMSRVVIGICIVLAALIFSIARPAKADELPQGAVKYIPVLLTEQKASWPGMPMPSALAAQVEQETCITLKHPYCWNPRAELKTPSEYGFGLSMMTVTSRFNTFEEMTHKYQSLKGWAWKDRFDPQRQLRALVLKDSECFSGQRNVATSADSVYFMLSCYNGGGGGLTADRRLCRATAGCDAGKWFGNVERTSYKARIAAKGYAKPAYVINREYVRNIALVRRPRYLAAMGGA